MMFINISLNLQTIKTNDEIEIEVTGCCIYYNNNHYIISVHQGFPIKTVSINNKFYTNYIICAWCDLLIIPIDDVFPDLFVFKQFVKKQIEPTDKLLINDNKVKFKQHEFMEIGMIPNNPTIMYNVFLNDNNVLSGQPIYNHKLAGIVSKVSNDSIYTIPIHYILIALNKKDNSSIYSLNEDISNIYKINKYKILDGKIYCPLHKMYISVETYIIINSEMNNLLVLKNRRVVNALLNNTTNNNYNSNLIINNNKITFTSSFMHLLKLLDNNKLIEDILVKLMNNIQLNEININE